MHTFGVFSSNLLRHFVLYAVSEQRIEKLFIGLNCYPEKKQAQPSLSSFPISVLSVALVCSRPHCFSCALDGHSPFTQICVLTSDLVMPMFLFNLSVIMFILPVLSVSLLMSLVLVSVRLLQIYLFMGEAFIGFVVLKLQCCQKMRDSTCGEFLPPDSSSLQNVLLNLIFPCQSISGSAM